eukprot:Lankesteria_metandrocarpae@DN5087_c0_g3_i1.p1
MSLPQCEEYTWAGLDAALRLSDITKEQAIVGTLKCVVECPASAGSFDIAALNSTGRTVAALDLQQGRVYILSLHSMSCVASLPCGGATTARCSGAVYICFLSNDTYLAVLINEILFLHDLTGKLGVANDTGEMNKREDNREVEPLVLNVRQFMRGRVCKHTSTSAAYKTPLGEAVPQHEHSTDFSISLCVLLHASVRTFSNGNTVSVCQPENIHDEPAVRPNHQSSIQSDNCVVVDAIVYGHPTDVDLEGDRVLSLDAKSSNTTAAHTLYFLRLYLSFDGRLLDSSTVTLLNISRNSSRKAAETEHLTSLVGVHTDSMVDAISDKVSVIPAFCGRAAAVFPLGNANAENTAGMRYRVVGGLVNGEIVLFDMVVNSTSNSSHTHGPLCTTATTIASLIHFPVFPDQAAVVGLHLCLSQGEVICTSASFAVAVVSVRDETASRSLFPSDDSSLDSNDGDYELTDQQRSYDTAGHTGANTSLVHGACTAVLPFSAKRRKTMSDPTNIEYNCPTSTGQCPTSTGQCPTSTVQCPAATAQCPTSTAQCPTSTAQCPTSTVQCPAATAQCPATTAQCAILCLDQTLLDDLQSVVKSHPAALSSTTTVRADTRNELDGHDNRTSAVQAGVTAMVSGSCWRTDGLICCFDFS